MDLGDRQKKYCKTVDEDNFKIRTNAAWTVIDGNAKVFLLGNVRIDKLLLAMKEQRPIVHNKTREIFYNSFCEE